ncbi:hypothetical protein J6590_093058 [Homalodisca vitripennis]|nr:hypothetical protein J6590_093058 [Homalodisca vitripennis]
MAAIIGKGDRVYVFATYFDTPNSGNAWSRSLFGSSYDTTKCNGTVIKVTCSWATVLWDIEKNTTTCLLKDLFSSDGRAVIAAGVTPAASAAIGLPRQVISPATLSDDAQKSKRRKTTVQLTSAENSSSSSSSDESNDEDEDLDSGSKNIIDLPADAEEIYNNSNLVLVIDAEWGFGKHVNIDQFKDHQYKPRVHLLNTNREILSINEIDFWLMFFPTDDINHILVCSNAHLRDRRKPISRHEFFKSIGMLYAMSINMLGVPRNYWSTETDGLFPAPAFGSRFGISLHRFEEILMAMAFAMPEDKRNGDRWYQVRPLINIVFPQVSKLTVDESTFAWYGKGNYRENGMPAVMKIKRKPKGVGCEDFGAGTATTLRLTEPWHGTGRIVVGDSWFSSVKTSIQLRERGMVKTAYRNYPLKQTVLMCHKEKGSFISATASSENVDLICVGWRDRKVHTFVGACSTTLPGKPCTKKRYDDDGKPYTKEVARPKLVDYFMGAPVIDIHNHIRQDGLALETVWQTQQWHHRMFACIFGIMETNAFLAYNLHRPALEKKSHSDFTKALALQLIKNQFGLPPETRPAEPLLIDEVNLPVEVISHVLVNLLKKTNGSEFNGSV